jgi:hypothetical protein
MYSVLNSTDLTYSQTLGIKGGQFFSGLSIFWQSFYVQIDTTIVSWIQTCPNLRKTVCNKFVCTKFVLVLLILM